MPSALLLLLPLAVASATPTRGEAAGAPAARRVYVGAYLTDVSDFDLKAGRFKADVMVWAKWMGDGAPPSISFENGEVESREELGLESDGDWRSVRWRVQGTFRGDFPVHSFPFDRQTLPVVFGLPQSDGQLVPDLGASGMSPSFSITGWNYEPYFSARSDQRAYASDLGSISREGQSTRVERVAFTVDLSRPTGPYLFKFGLPLLLILVMALLALFLPPTHIEVRSAMAMTALLSCFAFQYSQAQSLPDVSYLVAADALFLGGYIFITATLLISVISFRAREKRPALARWGDRLGVLGLPAAAVLSGVWVATAASTSPPKPPPLSVPKLRPQEPLLRVGVAALETLSSFGLPPRRAAAVVRGADGALRPVLVEEAPAMTNALVRLLPGGGMRVRWRLKEQVRWSDGTPITSEDLRFSIETILNPRRVGVEAVDARTIDVTYSARRSEFLTGFTIYPKAHLGRVYADGGREVMARAAAERGVPGAGPYVLESFEPGAKAALVRNPNLPGPRPVFERVQVTVLPKPEDAVKALLAGEVDVLPALAPEAWAALQDQPKVRLLEQPGDLLYVLVPNVKQGPFADVRARRALLQVLDREALAKLMAPLPARPAAGWRPGFESPAVPRHDPVEGARALGALGLGGASVPLHVAKMKNRASSYVRLYEEIARQLEAAGLEVAVEEHAELNPLFLKREFEGLLFTSRDTTDPTRYLNVPYAGGHYDVEAPAGTHFDAPMVEAYERFASSLYAERRAALERKLMALWAERLPMLPLLLTSRVAAVRADLEGPELGEADALYWNLTDWHTRARREGE